MRFDLAIIVPTKNEAGNVTRLVELLDAALGATSWQAIFVDDDSSDGTADIVRRMAEGRDNVICLRRIGRQGLSSAVIEGMMATGAEYIAVMDADLQHDETLLPQMLRRLRQGELDLVVASRFLEGSARKDFSPFRERLSTAGIFLAHLVARRRLTDPLSGFFMVRRSVVEEVVPRLNGQGFKILLDILASSRHPLRVEEMSFTFRRRQAGESKLDALVGLEFLLLLFDKLAGRILPARFLMFLLVGFSGILVHLALLGTLHRLLRQDFLPSQIAATLAAMTSNFFLNNRLTFRDRRLHGKRLMSGLLMFYAVCGLGAGGNFLISQFLFGGGVSWWLSGLAGAAISAMWNYGVNTSFTWSPRR